MGADVVDIANHHFKLYLYNCVVIWDSVKYFDSERTSNVLETRIMCINFDTCLFMKRGVYNMFITVILLFLFIGAIVVMIMW